MKRHTTDMISLVFGIAFVGIAAWWLISLYLDLRVPHLGWFAAGGLILFGLFGVFASLRGGESTAPAQLDESARPVEPTRPDEPARLDEEARVDEPARLDEEPAHTSPPSP
jgi:hypothetical protein